MTTSKQSFKAWVFTVNNPIVPALPQDWIDKCEFLTYQLERGENGTPHFQGYLVLKKNANNKNGRTLAWMKREISEHAHWEPRRGTHQQAVEYCNKTESRVDGPWTFGVWSDVEGPARGGEKNASKILAVKRLIDDGADDAVIWNAHFGEMLRYKKGFYDYRLTMSNKFRNWQTKAVWFWGPPGTGKSHRAYEAALKITPEPYYLDLSDGKAWFDGMAPYCKCVVVEDFRGNAPISLMLKLLDHTPMQVQTKGSMMPFAAEWIIFTSNSHPRDVYGQQAETKIPLEVLNAWHSRFEGDRGTIVKMEKVFTSSTAGKNVAKLFDELEKTELQLVDLTTDETLEGSPPHEHGDDDDDDGDGYIDGFIERDGMIFRDQDELISYENDLLRQDKARLIRTSYGRMTMDEAQTRFEQPPPPRKHAGDDDDDVDDKVDLRQAQKLRRTDTSTLGIERVRDDRWGDQPVQSKLSLKPKVLATMMSPASQLIE